jgi:hypothetical protein
MMRKQDFTSIASLDLRRIKAKLIHPASGVGWDARRADAAEVAYRQFLCLMKLFPTEQVAPLKDVDTFWHYHILDTSNYAADCERIFGYFLHHDPYFGLGDEEDHKAWARGAERMRELYGHTFGAQSGPLDGPAFCGVAAGPVANEAAFCGVAVEAAANAAAFCGVAVEPAVNAAAFCGVAVEPATNAAAFCGVAGASLAVRQLLQAGLQAADAAFCGVQAGSAACAGSVQRPAKQRAVGKPRRQAQVQRRLRR